MEIIFIFLILAFLIAVGTYEDAQEEAEYKRNTMPANTCPPHKWSLKKQPDSNDEYLSCDKCKKTPGEGF